MRFWASSRPSRPLPVAGAGGAGEGRQRHLPRASSPTVPLSREIFKAPTRFYKAGIAFLSWLNGSQTHFVMPGGFQSSREITHYAEVFRLADQARLWPTPTWRRRGCGRYWRCTGSTGSKGK
jgi:hypothetical protein